ncbi:hypothetical protein Y032_0101g3422 [Ancylostoma ceylanicum]|uniref:Uncharacterized protein n=1 Tax=Ancylostoma ceylanicum TaxID=53326 RepID=A0A016TI79_9BILA|nr:hypothetical protein Y032_0101g3422 [Ancylostoma ceylanicum]
MGSTCEDVTHGMSIFSSFILLAALFVMVSMPGYMVQLSAAGRYSDVGTVPTVPPYGTMWTYPQNNHNRRRRWIYG